MIRSYLNTEATLYLILISIVVFIFGGLLANLIWYLIFAAVVFCFRQKKLKHKDNPIQAEELLVSPLNGKVVKIQVNDEGTQITIVQPWFREIGLYIPLDCDVINVLKIRGSSFFRYSNLEKLRAQGKTYYEYFMELQTKNKKFVKLRMFKCFAGLKPSLSVLGGDRGKTGARYGFFPFGGTMVMIFGHGSDILVRENENVIAGETLIARLK